MEESHKKVARRPYHHGNLRETLIEAGKDLLASEGLAGFDLRKVARQAGVSHNAPYHHFADKQALLAAIAQTGFETLNTRIQAQLKEKPPADTRATLVALAQSYVRFAVEQPANMREMFSGLTIERAAYPELYAASKTSMRWLLEVIERGQAEGEIKAGNLDFLAWALWSQVHGMAMLIIENQVPEAQGNQALIEQMIEVGIDTLYGGLKAKS